MYEILQVTMDQIFRQATTTKKYIYKKEKENQEYKCK